MACCCIKSCLFSDALWFLCKCASLHIHALPISDQCLYEVLRIKIVDLNLFNFYITREKEYLLAVCCNTLLYWLHRKDNVTLHCMLCFLYFVNVKLAT